MLKRIFHIYFLAGAWLMKSCCPEGSPFDLNDTDKATFQSIAEFELYQMEMMDLARASGGAAEVVAQKYDWNHAAIALDLRRLADNNSLVLPTDLNQHYSAILKDLQNAGSPNFNEQFLQHAAVELSVLKIELEKEKVAGADIGIVALNEKLLPFIMRQHTAIDSLRQAN